MKKLSFMLTLIAVLLLAACDGGSSDSSSGSGGQTEDGKQIVTFWHSMGGAGQDVLNSIVEDFNASQDKIEVVAEYQGSATRS